MRGDTTIHIAPSPKCRTCYGRGTITVITPKAAPGFRIHCSACLSLDASCGDHPLDSPAYAIRQCGCVRIRRPKEPKP